MKKVAIIGGGIVGASVAYHLAKRDVDVTVFDRQEIGSATKAAAGIICPWLSQRRNKAWYALANGGANYYPTLVQMLEKDGFPDTGYAQVGALAIQPDETKFEKMMDRGEKRRPDAPVMGKLFRLSAEDAKDKWPYLNEIGNEVAFVTGAARVDGAKLQNALLQGAAMYGAQIRCQSADPWIDSNSVRGVDVAGIKETFDEVIVTAGAWANECFISQGIDMQVRGQKAQIVHLKVDEDTSKWPVVMPPNDQYFVAFEDGKIVVGATHEDEAMGDVRVTVGGVHEVLEKALAFMPLLKNAELVEVKTGFRPFTPDFLPVFGAVPGFNGMWFANGLGASGLTAGPFVGAELARKIVGDEGTIDHEPYALDKVVRPI